jgi:Cd2+/Zn2+-exporting ATPase|nr:hypothetical protein [Thiomonas sp.]
MVARLLLVTMMISAVGLTFGREILEDGPTGADSVLATASAAQDDGHSNDGDLGAKLCDHSCHNTSHFLGIKAVFFALALAGQATLWMAVFADMGASLLVVFNGLHLLRVRESAVEW